MTTIENQYAFLFSQLGYSTEFFPDKSLFFLKDFKTYCKICDDPAPPEIIEQALFFSKRHTIILLEGAVSYKSYRCFMDGEETCECHFLDIRSKYFPFFFSGDFNLDYFETEARAIALAIKCGEDIECHRCGLVNDFTVSKPSIHFKITCKCGNYITNSSENKESQLFFGKYKGRTIKSMQSTDELRYLEWGLSQNMFKGKLKKDIQERLISI